MDPNGKCKANGINKEKRSSWEISQYDTWALNAAYGGPLPPCQRPDKVTGGGRQEVPLCQVADGKCDRGNNNLGCGYDGGDCCLPQAKVGGLGGRSLTSVCRTRTVLIPVGSGSSSMEEGTVSEQGRYSKLECLLFAGPCRKAPVTDQFCADHYWYGPNKCGKEYCR